MRVERDQVAAVGDSRTSRFTVPLMGERKRQAGRASARERRASALRPRGIFASVCASIMGSAVWAISTGNPTAAEPVGPNSTTQRGLRP